MACKRDRIIDIVKYLELKGVTVNIGKNKARGNSGFFKSANKTLRIDLSKSLSDEELLKVLVHEFAHFIHYNYDPKLSSLEKILGTGYEDIYMEELLNITVSSISKKSIEPLFNKKEFYSNQIKIYSDKLKLKYKDFKYSDSYRPIESEIMRSEYKYLLKYDNVCVKSPFKIKKYSVDNIEQLCQNQDIVDYIKLRSANRAMKRIMSKISRLNKYYNSHSELFARSVVYYIFSAEEMKKNAKNLYNKYNDIIKNNCIPCLNDLIKILQV